MAYIADTSGKGYSSFIQMLVSLDTDLKVKDVNILHHGETPGLGDQVEDRKLFLDQFQGKALQQLVLIKGETKENIQAITGATISSRAVTNGARDAVQMLVDKYGAGVGSAAGGQGATHEVKHEHKPAPISARTLSSAARAEVITASRPNPSMSGTRSGSAITASRVGIRR